MSDTLKSIIEAIIFASDKPVSNEMLFALIDHVPTEDVKAAVSDLVSEYTRRGGGFYLCQTAGGVQFRTRPAYKNWVVLLKKKDSKRLSKAALETLSIIAYKQPVIRSDIEYIRGVDSGSLIRTLLEMKLVRVAGKKDLPGRPLIYTTTRHFLEVFELKSLKELPDLKEFAGKES